MDVCTDIKEKSSRLEALKRNVSIYFPFGKISGVKCYFEELTTHDPFTKNM